MDYQAIITELEKDLVFVDTFAKVRSVMDQYTGKVVRVAYSGGADSDVVMWLLRILGYDVHATFFNTGLEYQATWRQLEYMCEQGFTIEVLTVEVPVAVGQKKHGHPFVSKRVSELLERLQQHNFDFQNDGPKPLEELLKLYPRTRAALRWWCNDFPSQQANIRQNKWLKEFLIANGLPFRVSGKCCEGAKKAPARKYARIHGVDMMLMGIRKSEGGARSTAYKSCFVQKKGHSLYDMFLPIFWWSDADRAKFEQLVGIQHSACYTEYGLNRTGCAGCPFGRNFEKELVALEANEPKLYKGIQKIFDGSFAWTRKYREFATQMQAEEKAGKND